MRKKQALFGAAQTSLAALQPLLHALYLDDEQANSMYCYFTRSTYCPVRVSMRILSPGFTNRGTLTTAPVSSVAGFVTLLAVSPRTPGSALSTVSSTKLGNSTAMILSPSTSISTISCSLMNCTALPSISLGMGC